MAAGFTGRLAIRASRLGRFVLASGDSGSGVITVLVTNVWRVLAASATWVLQFASARSVPQQQSATWVLPKQDTVWRLAPEDVTYG